MEQAELQKWMEETSLRYFDKVFKHQARFNSRLRTTGGRYLLRSHDIEMNPKYLFHYGADYFLGIMKHELCHYHLHLEGKGYMHRDAEFRALLKAVDAPRFCKAIEPDIPKHVYVCEQCGQDFFRKRKFNVNRYACGKCGGKLQYIANGTASSKRNFN
ncbi:MULTISPECIES: SprT family protein [Listeria]|uniref:SprT family protein n=1 Tax=Listeria TaxID=1637 RepID=UPI000B592CA3|nr:MULTISPECIES: SprT family protein [Listeria]